MFQIQTSSSSSCSRIAKYRVIVYIATLIAFTILANRVAMRIGNSPLSSLVIMWSPGLAAIIASIITRRSLKEIGWRPWPVKWLAAGWILPILYALPAYSLIWIIGLGSVPNPVFLERARLTLGMGSESDWLVIFAAFGYITIFNLLPTMILAVGEEIGWRGFLVPELTKWIGFYRASLLSGLIWSLWHWPGILTDSYGFANTPIAYRLACFTALVVTSGIIMAWLRMKSGSIWPVAIMHTTHNGAVQAFFDRITAETGSTRYFTGEFGVAMIPFSIAIAWYCWRRAGEVDLTSGADPSTTTTHPEAANARCRLHPLGSELSG